MEYKVKNGVGIIPQGTKNIVTEAFANCEELTAIEIPEGVTSIDQRAFEGCTNLRDISFPSTLEFIDTFVFTACESLARVEFPKSLKSVGYQPFLGAGIEELVLHFSNPDDFKSSSENGLKDILNIVTRRIVVPDGSLDTFTQYIKDKFCTSYEKDTRDRLLDILVEESEAKREKTAKTIKGEAKKKQGEIDIKKNIKWIILGLIALWLILQLLIG